MTLKEAVEILCEMEYLDANDWIAGGSSHARSRRINYAIDAFTAIAVAEKHAREES